MLIEVTNAPATPGTHALVIGVSRYRFADGPEATPQAAQFGLANLTSAARSASEVAAWLLTEYRNPAAPLATLEVLVSPVEGETLHPELASRLDGQPAPATREAVEVAFNRFRTRCRTNTDNLAFVYVVGHGIQLNKRGAVLLLEDFGTPDRDLLYGALDVVGCRDAMDETGNADHQVWFCDACRQRPDVVRRFETLIGGYRPDEGTGQVAASPIFLASSSRESAFAVPEGTSIFNQALLWALRGGAATGPDGPIDEWHVPTSRLTSVLPQRVRELLADVDENQQVDVTGRVLEVITHRFAEPPEVDVGVTIDPPDLTPAPVPELLFAGGDPQPLDPTWPLAFKTRAGIYLLRTVPDAAGRSGWTSLDARPPACRAEVKVR